MASVLSYPRGILDLMTVHAHNEVLVGREADLSALRDALKRTHAAEPSTVLVGGEAGVGKTRLIEEFRRSVAGEPGRVLVGGCLELGEEGLSFAPFTAALRELLRAEGPGVFDGREHEFAGLLPELGPPAEAPGGRLGLLFESVGALLARLSEQRPLVLVLEDLHWADRSTRDLVGFLVRSARLPRVLIIGTYRTDELQRGHPLRPFLAELDRVRGVRRVELDRFDREGTAKLLTLLLGAEPEAALIDTVNERTQGNPFFIEQFAASTDPLGCDIPSNLRDLLLSRVDLLPEPAQRVLRVAAVGGTRFGHELLSRVAGMDEPALEAALRTVVAAQMIVVDSDEGYEFRHALVREAVHDDLLPGEHARLHARYAQAVEAEPHLVLAGRAPAEIAHHWYAAHDHPRALVAAKQAADEAACRLAYGEQARLLDRVIELWEQVPGAESLTGTCHLDLLEEAALVAIDYGEHMRAIALTRAALRELDAEAEPLRAARLLVRRAKLLRTAGTSDGRPEYDEAYRLLAGVPSGPDRARLLSDLAYACGTVADPQAISLAQEALAEAEGLGDVAALVAAEVTYGRMCAGAMSLTEGLPIMRSAADRARAAGDLPGLARALVVISDSLFAIGHYAASAEAAAEGVPHADRIEAGRQSRAYLLANHAEALIALGRWDEAEAGLARAARQYTPGTMALPWMRLLGLLRLARGHDGAEPLLARAIAVLSKPFLLPQDRFSLLELRILLALDAGDGPVALGTARSVAADPTLVTSPRYAWPLLVAAARAAAGALPTGSLPAAGSFSAAGSLPAADSRAAGGAGPAPAGSRDAGGDLRQALLDAAAVLPRVNPADHAHAAVTEALLLGGAARWTEAVTAGRADGRPYELARSLVGLAEARAADRAAATELLGEAAEIARALGAQPLRSEIDTLARRLGVRPSATPHPAAEGTEILTAREREVLRLVAEGHSNSRIAQTLFISPKTASVHISRIIAKLDVANRIEAAAVAHRLGLLAEPQPVE